MDTLIKIISLLITLFMLFSFNASEAAPQDTAPVYTEDAEAVETAPFPAPLPAVSDAVLVYTENMYEIVSSFSKEISLPVIVLYKDGSDAAAEKINADLKSVYDSACSAADEYGRYSDPNGYYSFYISDIGVSGNILSITFDESSYTGGAHPMHFTDMIQYDLVSGERFSVKNVILGLDDDQRAQFESLLVSALMPYNSRFMTDAAAVAYGAVRNGPGNWSISSEGLSVSFNPGDIAPYSEGMISATISAADLSGIISGDYFAERDKSGTGSVTLADLWPTDMSGVQFGPQTACGLVISGDIYDLKETHAGGIYVYLSHGCTGVVTMPEDPVGLLSASWYSGGSEFSLSE